MVNTWSEESKEFATVLYSLNMYLLSDSYMPNIRDTSALKVLT